MSVRTGPDVSTHPDPDTFRRAMGLLPTGVTVITAGSGEHTEALTVSSVTSVSLAPLLVLVSVGTRGRMLRRIEEHGAFTVNVMARDQEPLSRLFASHDRPVGTEAQRWLGDRVGRTGNVLVEGAVLSVDCRTENRYPGGDHAILLGRVNAVHTAEHRGEPLLHHRGAYAGLAAGVMT
ncbi:flavin reductase family protein [Streptomyces sp. CNQ085]|uniref:flavin reductase family protein n=1 Tax=Streptomyces sp. CNQ085 TaxID=2886944 RepID=UPI001F512901|nr:flavin reductase family protein [Streptomyces sp. CNQ085]MCI0386302.1 flavin reductase family protein [Streptomyces sp. CNQ085]